MRGRADDDGREAILPLTAIGRSGVRAEVEAALDTGFTGSLCLPPDIVRSLSAPLVGLTQKRPLTPKRDGGYVDWLGL
jgi:predicted aspartyl protease